MGPVRVKVLTDVLKSQYNGGEYVFLEVNGEERTYTMENPTCSEFFREQKGRVFTLVAEGSREQAVLTYVGEAASTPPPSTPPPRRQTAPPPAPVQQAAPPPVTRPPSGPPPVAARQSTPPPSVPEDRALKQARIYIARRVSLMKITMKATSYLGSELKAMGLDIMDPEMFNSINATLFISAERAGMASFLPQRINSSTLEPEAGGTRAAAPVQQAPPQEPEPEQEPPPEEENRPF